MRALTFSTLLAGKIMVAVPYTVCTVDQDFSPVKYFIHKNFVYHMAGNFRGCYIVFMESPKRPLKLIFVVLNFVTATSPGVWHCTSDDVIDTRT